jgi:putative PIN family toxin of toxin-antitoxin system
LAGETKERPLVSSEQQRLKVVFDCNVFLQGVIKEKGPAVDCLELFERDEIELFISDEVLNEVRDVLSRPMLQKKFPLLTDERADRLVETLLRQATLIDPVPHKFSYSRDPRDEPYINLAAAAKADFIVSRDNDLLDLMTGITVECKEFRQRFRPLKVINSVDFLKEVEKLRPA